MVADITSLYVWNELAERLCRSMLTTFGRIQPQSSRSPERDITLYGETPGCRVIWFWDHWCPKRIGIDCDLSPVKKIVLVNDRKRGKIFMRVKWGSYSAGQITGNYHSRDKQFAGTVIPEDFFPAMETNLPSSRIWEFRLHATHIWYH